MSRKFLILSTILLAILFLLKILFIPVYKNDYPSIHHSESIQMLPLPENWTYQSQTQFIDEWWQSEPHQGHFKKVIEHNWFSVKSETDYFMDSNSPGVFYAATYNFEKERIQYFRIDQEESQTKLDEYGRIRLFESSFNWTEISPADFKNEILP